jgi:hypothetical protein
MWQVLSSRCGYIRTADTGLWSSWFESAAMCLFKTARYWLHLHTTVKNKTVLKSENFLRFSVSSASRRILPANIHNSVNKSLQLDLSWTSWCQSTLSYKLFFITRFNIILISTPRTTKSLVPSGVSTEINSPRYFHPPHVCQIPRPFHTLIESSLHFPKIMSGLRVRRGYLLRELSRSNQRHKNNGLSLGKPPLKCRISGCFVSFFIVRDPLYLKWSLWNLERKRLIGKYRNRWEDNIKIKFWEIW